MFVIAMYGSRHYYSVMPNREIAEKIFETNKNHLPEEDGGMDLLEILSDRVVVLKTFVR